jgi:hypothetical protein
MNESAVEWLADEIIMLEEKLRLEEININDFMDAKDELVSKALKMEDSQATDYAKWSMDINELTGHFFTFREWIKDEPKDDETSKQE